MRVRVVVRGSDRVQDMVWVQVGFRVSTFFLATGLGLGLGEAWSPPLHPLYAISQNSWIQVEVNHTCRMWIDQGQIRLGLGLELGLGLGIVRIRM